jgi:hypothetical protein
MSNWVSSPPWLMYSISTSELHARTPATRPPRAVTLTRATSVAPQLTLAHLRTDGKASAPTGEPDRHLRSSCWEALLPLRLSGGPAQLEHAGRMISLGVLNLYVPYQGKIFVSPSLIAHDLDAHDLDAHDYAPPEDHQEAVLACPPMRSMEYLKAMVKNGPPGFTRGGRDGAPYGTRTRVTAVKGRRPRPLDEGRGIPAEAEAG